MTQMDDGLSGMEAAAAALHEWFITLMRVGFTEQQALSLIAHQVNLSEDDDS
jgi:hypothetical protein